MGLLMSIELAITDCEVLGQPSNSRYSAACYYVTFNSFFNVDSLVIVTMFNVAILNVISLRIVSG